MTGCNRVRLLGQYQNFNLNAGEYAGGFEASRHWSLGDIE